MIDHSRHQQSLSTSSFSVSRMLTGLAVGGAVAGAAIILAPHILPALGIGSAEMAEESMFVLHASADGGGSGVAGVINRVLAATPVIGDKLAEGGLFNASVTAAVGIGGVLLGNFIEKREDGSKRIKWGSAIRYGALITSALVAMPTVFTALSTGLIFLSTLPVNIHLANSVVHFVENTLGTASNMEGVMMGFSGLAAAIPHFLTCGVAMLPATLSLFLSKEKTAESKAIRHYKYSDGSVIADIITDAPLETGKTCRARLMLRHRDGRPLSADELAVVHTEKLHLFVADSSLKDYHHIHPRPAGNGGGMEFSFTPKISGHYSAWADFTMLKDGHNHKLKLDLKSASNRRIPPSIRPNTRAEKDGLYFEWSGDPLRQDTDAVVIFRITDARGNPVSDLEPVMGAFAHLVGFSADGQSLIHTHPLGAEPQNAGDRGGPNLRFHIEPDCTGPTQFYLQINRDGRDVYVPFGQHILPPEHATERNIGALRTSHAYGL